MKTTVNAVLWRSVRAHGLLAPASDVESAVRAAAGIYGAAPTCSLSLAARVGDFTPAVLDTALYERRTLLRVPAMRGSVYLLPLDLVWHGLALAASVNLAPLLERAGLSGATCQEVTSSIEKLLGGRPKTAAEIRAGLVSWQDSPSGVLTLVLRQMSHEGRIVRTRVRGGWRSQAFEYARMADWVRLPKRRPTVEQALRALAPLYFAANGPATVADFAWWAGVSKKRASNLVSEMGLETVVVEDLPGPLLATPGTREALAEAPRRWNDLVLLPYWDAYLMAHADRQRYLDPRRQPLVVDRGGNVTNVLLRGGRVVGLWDVREETLLYAPFGKVPAAAIRRAAQPLLPVLGVTEVTPCALPTALAAQGQNAFLAPHTRAAGSEGA